MRRSLRILEACDRLRARRKPGTAMAARRAMTATTIIISTRVKPPRLVANFLNMTAVLSFYFYCVRRCDMRDPGALPSQLVPCHSRRCGNDRRMNREDSYL